MATFEHPSWERLPRQHGELWLNLPGVIDEEWCDAFTSEFGYGARRVIISSDFCLVQSLHWTGHAYEPSNPKIYDSLDAEHYTGEPQPVIDGRIIGIMMVPDVRDEEMIDPEPHLVLDEVTNMGEAITRHRLQQVLVPIIDKDELILYD